ncbi:MAG: glycoside hydrolase family 3 protein [Alphaproteobacteria bacterium]|nr:glycoside hydrolase family 3 protein [Alphaproteobacteria bacterium]
MKKILFLLLCPTLLLLGCSEAPQENFLKKEIGQMVLVGFRGKTVPHYLKDDLKSGRIGGLILFDYDVVKGEFDRNIESPEQVKLLVSEVQSYAETPAFIAIDQEGGKVARLTPQYGFPPTLSAQKLGKKNDLKATYENAEIIALTLKSLGINLNFAPVVDLNINPNNPAIGKKERSYSADPKIVTQHAQKVIQAHKKYNILTSLKHFPGHGSGWNDSHEGFVDLTDTWSEKELIPYEKLSAEVPMVMTAHIFNKNLDSDVPGTLSQKVITGILRNKIGFKGVVISDDLQMNAIDEHYSLEETVVKLINAGVDILLVGNNLNSDTEIDEKIQEIILDKIESGEIAEKQIHESYQRIIKLKKEYGIIK